MLYAILTSGAEHTTNKHLRFIFLQPGEQGVCMISGEFAKLQICSLLFNLHLLIVCFLLLSGSDPINTSSVGQKEKIKCDRLYIFFVLK